MEIQTFRVGSDYHVGASFSDSRIALLTPDMRSLVAHFRLPADCRGCFDLSCDGRRLAVGLSYTDPCHIEVRDVSSGRVEAALPRTFAFDVGLAGDGRTILYWSDREPSRTWVHDLVTGDRTFVRGAFGRFAGSWARQRDALLLRQYRGPGGVRLRFDPLRVEPLTWPSRRGTWAMAASPLDDTFAALDGDGYVWRIDAGTGAPLWRQRVRKAGWVAFTGDGRFLGLEQHEGGSGVARTVILDAATGELVRKVERREVARYPLSGPRLLCASGRVLNAETGEVADGVSSTRWWYEQFPDDDAQAEPAGQ